MNEMTFLRELGTNIDRTMRFRDMSQRELARRSGVDNCSVSRYISGDRMPTLKNIINIAVALDCSVEFLLPSYEHIY